MVFRQILRNGKFYFTNLQNLFFKIVEMEGHKNIFEEFYFRANGWFQTFLTRISFFIHYYDLFGVYMVFEKYRHVYPKLAMCDFYPENNFGKIRPKNESILADFARLGLFLVQYFFTIYFPRDDYLVWSNFENKVWDQPMRDTTVSRCILAYFFIFGVCQKWLILMCTLEVVHVLESARQERRFVDF